MTFSILVNDGNLLLHTDKVEFHSSHFKIVFNISQALTINTCYATLFVKGNKVAKVDIKEPMCLTMGDVFDISVNIPWDKVLPE
jgi:hypothetical protein